MQLNHVGIYVLGHEPDGRKYTKQKIISIEHMLSSPELVCFKSLEIFSTFKLHRDKRSRVWAELMSLLQ